MVPLGKATWQTEWTPPFFLVGSGELAEVVEKDNHEDILLSGPRDAQLQHLGEQRCHLLALGRGTLVTLVLQVWARHRHM